VHHIKDEEKCHNLLHFLPLVMQIQNFSWGNPTLYILGRIQKYPEKKRTVPTLAMKLEEKHKPAS